MLWFVILGLVAIAIVSALAATAPQQAHTDDVGPACPSCEAPMIALTDGPSTEPGQIRSYDVLACPRCTQVDIRVHGVRSRLAYCPSCLQRALDTSGSRIGAAGLDPLQVVIHERCHLCGHQAEHPIERRRPRAGKVIPFRRPGRRSRG